MTEDDGGGCRLFFFTFGFNVVRDLWIGIRIWITAVRFDRRLELTADVYSFSRRLYFQLFFLFTNIPVHLYSSRLRRRYRRSILTAVMLGLSLHCYRVPGIRWHNNRWLALWSRYNAAGLQLLFYGLILSLWEITLHCYSNYISIWIIQPAVRFYRRYDLTEDSLYVSFFNCSFWR
jgi:hypothetical protein